MATSSGRSPAEGDRYALIVQGASGDRLVCGAPPRMAGSSCRGAPDAVQVRTGAPHGAGRAARRGRASGRPPRTCARRSRELAKDDEGGRPALRHVDRPRRRRRGRREVQSRRAGPHGRRVERDPQADSGRSVAFVDTTSSSFPYLAGLAAPGRVIVTATNSFAQRYHTVFADAFIQALEASAADADKNGRISLLEAFTYASRLVAQHYEQDGRLATENSPCSTTRATASAGWRRRPGADGVGRRPHVSGLRPSAEGRRSGSAAVAAATAGADRARSTNCAAGGRRMPPEEFDREFEKLIVELALVSRDVRRRTGEAERYLGLHQSTRCALGPPEEPDADDAGDEARRRAPRTPRRPWRRRTPCDRRRRRSCIRNHSPRKKTAGTSTTSKKNDRKTSTSTRECGNSTRYAPMTPAMAPLAPTSGRTESGLAQVCGERRRRRRPAGRRRETAPWPIRSSTLSPKIQRRAGCRRRAASRRAGTST